MQEAASSGSSFFIKEKVGFVKDLTTLMLLCNFSFTSLMALAKDQKIPHGSSMSNKVQTCVFNETDVSIITDSPPLCGSGNGYTYKGTNYQLEEAESLINFKGYSMQASESFPSFQQSRYCAWENNLHQGHNQWNQSSPKSTTNLHMIQDFNYLQTANGYGSNVNDPKEKQHDQSSSRWLYSAPTVPDDNLHKSGAQEFLLKKRPSMGENMKGAKKQCSSESKMSKHESSPSKDPQSVAAKNRRERISKRLKMLQELVPNGSKVDLVTMLEKAISYVKFLQLQVKVLTTDEFWPVQGGKPLDISQVKETINAMLSSQR
ncbi:hypothetical protein VNO77_43628 [Canavalia gladiata]|uniref:BHLH domain-containing protein n=1 Tax=Canavalia gladiata TaxID=3824 RepID=A0AAN9PQ75_CANGL